MNHPLYHRAAYTMGAANISQLPPETGGLIEVAFAGRSNAGKSSAINRITHQKSLARTSKTPGRTQLINFFQLDEQRFLVDLPGYGYAKVSEKIKRQWQHTLELYLRERQCLRGLVLMMDVRHPFTDFDTQMLEWCKYTEMPVHILVTKADKLGRGAAGNVLQKVRNVLARDFDVVRETPWATAQLFSALKGTGLAEVQAKLDVWFDYSRE